MIRVCNVRRCWEGRFGSTRAGRILPIVSCRDSFTVDLSLGVASSQVGTVRLGKIQSGGETGGKKDRNRMRGRGTEIERARDWDWGVWMGSPHTYLCVAKATNPWIIDTHTLCELTNQYLLWEKMWWLFLVETWGWEIDRWSVQNEDEKKWDWFSRQRKTTLSKNNRDGLSVFLLASRFYYTCKLSVLASLKLSSVFTALRSKL